MSDTDKLTNVLDNIIDQNAEQAQVNFHDYLRDKIQSVINDQQSADNDEGNKE